MLPQCKACLNIDCKGSCAAFCALDESQGIPRYVCVENTTLILSTFHWQSWLDCTNSYRKLHILSPSLLQSHSYCNWKHKSSSARCFAFKRMRRIQPCKFTHLVFLSYFVLICFFKVVTWTMDSICLCGGHWREHEIPYDLLSALLYFDVRCLFY